MSEYQQRKMIETIERLFFSESLYHYNTEEKFFNTMIIDPSKFKFIKKNLLLKYV